MSADPFHKRYLIYGADLGAIVEGSHRTGDLRFTTLDKFLNIPEDEIRLWERVHLGKFGVVT
ncbi:hypothetical protein JG688_00007833 [Phytophthora aleatoria]|uniref:Uncharacterized protein n=1 Tax=Phytophthora aleatoria TaxID=2496075 RepID=A0A8J5MGC0_9STRA|nr:hypothetical protein JG688_00007833 [Phytophthora aleatoria]